MEALGTSATAECAGAMTQLLLYRFVQTMDKADLDTLATAGLAGGSLSCCFAGFFTPGTERILIP